MSRRPFTGKLAMIIEDNLDYGEFLRINLIAEGFNVHLSRSAVDARKFLETGTVVDVFVIDMYFPEGNNNSRSSLLGPDFAVEMRLNHPESIIIGISARIDDEPRVYLRNVFNAFLSKADMHEHEHPAQLLESIDTHLLRGGNKLPTVFIVHGHDEDLVKELKSLIVDEFKLPDPIILKERPDKGRTIIEKFEGEARRADLVIVCVTPDDLVSKGTDEWLQARPNVVFELGYFYGRFHRRRGRVILLRKDGAQVPSDLHGIVYINASVGVAKYKLELIRELDALGFHVSP